MDRSTEGRRKDDRRKCSPYQVCFTSQIKRKKKWKSNKRKLSGEFISRQTNIVARLLQNCCCGKAISVTYSECVFVVSVTSHANRLCLIRGVSDSTIFFYISS